MTDDIYTQLQDTPVLYRPIITTLDAQRGYVTRYFARRRSDKYSIIEIDSNQYERFRNNPLYSTTRLIWRIVGSKTTTLSRGIITDGIDSINKEAVKAADLTFGGLADYIIDYTEFWLYEV